MTIYPSPGRGAWRLTGGLLPAKPGSTSKAGYYRLAAQGELPVGSAWISGKDKSHHSLVVTLGVKALQTLVGATVDGWYGPSTNAAVLAAQTRLRLDVDGIVGRDTMRALLTPRIEQLAQLHGVPTAILGGIMKHESALDPAAVGVNGLDHGLAQINMGAHGAWVSLERALDPDFAITFTAEDLRGTYATWQTKARCDPWDVAIANHNSPALARKWAKTGEPPYVEGRVFQIAEYVANVRAAWD